MEVPSGAEEGFVREWTPCTHILNLIPPKIHTGLFSNDLSLTCVDAVSEYIALGTNVGLVYWYDRKKGNLQRLRCEASTSPITFVKIANTVDYMVGAGNAAGQVTVFQIPKEHPENIPDTLKPKVEPKVERYTIGDLHKSNITAIEWSKNGMRLFSGDKNGVIIMTEIDFYMHLCKSMEIVNEQHEIVQMSYHQNILLVSSIYRSIVCERRDGRWHVNQIGKKERKSLCALGGVLVQSYAAGGARGAVYCARAGLRLWRASTAGDVVHTLLFKEAVANPLTVAELLNPRRRSAGAAPHDHRFGPLHEFRDHFLVTHSDAVLYVLDPRTLTAVAVVDQLRSILSVSVNKEEIFVLEGARSLVRLAHAPEPAARVAEDPIDLMTKSLTTSIQQAVNTVRDFTQTIQINSVLEPMSMSLFDKINSGIIVNAEECVELPPIKCLPDDVSDEVLQSIVNEFRDVSKHVEEIRRVKSEELQRKLKLYNSIMEKKLDGELIHSRRGRRSEAGSGASSPRVATPMRRHDVAYTGPCVVSVAAYSNGTDEDDEILEREIEEKEKILAKMLNLESLSITAPPACEVDIDIPLTYNFNYDAEINYVDVKKNVVSEKKHNNVQTKPVIQKETKPIDLVPKMVQMPNNWNLDDLELKLDVNPGNNDDVLSSDDTLGSDWEII